MQREANSQTRMRTIAVRVIGIVDDDESVRESISSLVRSAGFACAQFSSAEAFLTSTRLHDVQCLIVDVRMPGLSGIELQRRLARMKLNTPIIFATALTDATVRAAAVREGAIAFLQKPFTEESLLNAISFCLQACSTHSTSSAQRVS